MRANGKEEERVRESERECAREWMQERMDVHNFRPESPNAYHVCRLYLHSFDYILQFVNFIAVTLSSFPAIEMARSKITE